MEKMCCYQSGVGLGGVLFTLELWKARGVPLSFGSCGIEGVENCGQRQKFAFVASK
tara:strand:+ start:290 stop:457 length:168 start_codon:yes stop_codon:yes gene_type:complete